MPKTENNYQNQEQIAEVENDAADKSATTGAENDSAEAERKFTQEDIDRVLKKRLQQVEAKKQDDIKAAVEKAIADYDRKAKMTEADRAAEASKEREAELTKRENDLAIRENRNKAIEVLTQKNIPTSLVKYIATADAEETEDNIAAFASDWSKALAAAVKDAARGTAPRDSRSEEDRNGKLREIKHSGTQVL